MSFWKPRTIRQQLTLGLVFIKVVSILLFAMLLLHTQQKDLLKRAQIRVQYLTNSLALQVRQAIEQNRPTLAQNAVQSVTSGPSINSSKVTDPAGNTLFSKPEAPDGEVLTPLEREQLAKVKGQETVSFTVPDDQYGVLYAAVRPVYSEGVLRAYVWVYTNSSMELQQMEELLRITAIFALIWITATLTLTWILTQSITRPLDKLLEGTRSVIRTPESLKAFPLPITSTNEVADLTKAFNLMVAAIEEQRAGLRDTLSLLDSMLAHAPIGFAFFDRRCRFVRVNAFFAEMMGNSSTGYIGRSVDEMLPASCATALKAAVKSVFETGEPVLDMELNMAEAKGDELALSAQSQSIKDRNWSWLTRIYPVRTRAEEVSWVGVIAMDTSERKRSEEAMRRTEKLAATGRLAASIAHEINNPLEAVTNLLYLLRNQTTLDPIANQYATLAEHELRRVAEITQQTLRFYRQSSQATMTSLCELMDSILNLHHGRQLSLGVEVRREYSPQAMLYCYSGEIRQVFANLIGNALDSMLNGGVMRLNIRRSRNWATGAMGVRIVVADTGTGMPREIQKHIFDAFFTTKDVTGTGLGLWVSSEIIRKHQGSIRVRSWVAEEGRSSGSVFVLFFPDTAVAAEEQATEKFVKA